MPSNETLTTASAASTDVSFSNEEVKVLKEKFDKQLKRFQKAKNEYEKFNSKDLAKADEKLKLMKNKLSAYGISDGSDMVDLLAQHEKLLKSDEGKAHAELKAKIKALESEMVITKAKQDIQLVDLRKQ